MCAEYSSVASFGGVYFDLGPLTVKLEPSTLKTNIGKTFVKKNIPLRNASDRIITISGVISGISRTSAQTLAEAIEVDRSALEALQDGYYRAFDCGRFSGNYVIVPGTLIFEDNADRTNGQPYKFTMEIISW